MNETLNITIPRVRIVGPTPDGVVLQVTVTPWEEHTKTKVNLLARAVAEETGLHVDQASDKLLETLSQLTVQSILADARPTTEREYELAETPSSGTPTGSKGLVPRP